MIASSERLAKVLEAVLAVGLITGVLLTILAWLWLGVKQHEATETPHNGSEQRNREEI